MAKRARARTHRRHTNHEVDEETGKLQARKREPAKPFDQLPNNDALEGVIRDPVIHNGEVVSYVTDVGVGDPEFDPNIRKVLLQPIDGPARRVPASEINKTVTPMVAEDRSPDRVPHLTFPAGHPLAFGAEGR